MAEVLGSSIGLLLSLTYGTPAVASNDVFLYGTLDSDAVPVTLSGADSTSQVDTDASPSLLKNPSTSGNVNSRQGNQSANSGTDSGILR